MTRQLSCLAFSLLLAACTSPMAVGPSQRPGLGTAWGETRFSSIHHVAFEREDPGRPVAVATLYYDDGDGVRALAGGAAPWDAPDGGFLARGALRVHLVDPRGVPLPVFTRGGRQYVEGRHGERYAIEIQNRSPGRVEAVATVDGLDVSSGRPGSFDRRGYVLDPWQTFRIEGFRRSMDEVAAFRFGAVSDSYAAETGDDSNVGIIGVALFAERGAVSPWLDDEAARRRGADGFPGRFAAPPPRERAW
jgi:hypothetical protein